MKHPTVILHTNAPDEAVTIVAAQHPDLPLHGCDSYEALPGLIAETGAEVIYSVRFQGGPGYPAAAALSPPVKWLSVGGSGVDHLGVWDPQAVTVTNAAGVAADMMAEYALGTALSFTLDLARYRRDQAARAWDPDAGVEPLEGKTCLILGLGKTGHAVARRMKAMGLHVIGVRARPKPTANCDEVHGMAALPDLWARADVLVVCVPLLPSTRGIVDGAAFAAMKPTAILVDVSRGGVIEEAPLLEALQTGRIRGAARDVYAQEPLPPESPFWDLPNLILTPHSSAVYDGWAARSVRMFAENLGRYRRGEPLSNIVDPTRGY